MDKPYHVEWMCTYCGEKKLMMSNVGRPLPGNCNKRPNKGSHRWVVNRRLSR